MPRLFITPRELAFVADITKEIIKDICGQKIIYYPISELKTKVHDVYLESPEKVFDNPIEIEVLSQSPKVDSKYDKFSFDQKYTIELYVQWRDLVDKGVTVTQGDFFQYGEIFYEIEKVTHINAMFGQIEHKDGVKITAVNSRLDQFKEKLFGPTDYSYPEPDAVQQTFVQQRGAPSNRLGPTNDTRELQKDSILEPPLTGPKEISRNGADSSIGSSFYGDDS